MSDEASNSDDLQFHEFRHGAGGQYGNLSPTTSPMRGGSAGHFDASGGEFSDTQGEISNATLRFWNIAYYQPWFNVDTSDVIKRIMYSVAPISSSFVEVAGDGDAWGPFWISTTLVFMLFSTGNFASWLTYYTTMHSSAGWQYDFTKVTTGAVAVYGYCALLPLALSFAFAYTGIACTYLQLLTVYGYSLFVYVPASIVAVLPYEMVQWLSILVAAMVSTLFLFRSLARLISSTPSAKKSASSMLTVAVILHLLLAFSFKYYFFNHDALLLAKSYESLGALGTTTTSPMTTVVLEKTEAEVAVEEGGEKQKVQVGKDDWKDDDEKAKDDEDGGKDDDEDDKPRRKSHRKKP